MDAIERLQGTHEDSARLTLGACDGVEAPIHAINEVDVGDARRSVQRIRAAGAPGGGVTCEVMLAEIGLRLDDATACHASRGAALEHGAEKLASDELRWPIVELARQRRRFCLPPD